MVKDGKKHIESLRDGRRIFIDGECVDDHVAHPAFRNAIASAASLFEYQAQPENLERMTFTSPKSGDRVSRMWQLPTSHTRPFGTRSRRRQACSSIKHSRRTSSG